METSQTIGRYITTDIRATPRYLHLRHLILVLLALPVTYFAISYCYLAWWHNEIFLWNTLVHENGRLTLSGSMFYFDHFVACVPMIVLFALFSAGGFALAGHQFVAIDKFRASVAAASLLGVAVLLVLGALVASIYTVGRQRTIDYALQRIERDGVMSTGGNWNQLQLSNIPIALGAISVSGTLIMFASGAGSKRDSGLITGGKICIAAAVTLMVGISALTFSGWQAFLNPRWMAHSIRELATYPITGIPIALIGILLAERYMSGQKAWVVKVGSISLIPIAVGLVIVAGQLIWLMNVDVMAMAQKPSFSADGLSIPYLLTSHVFEHFLDFVLICPLSGGIYALTRLLAQRQRSHDV